MAGDNFTEIDEREAAGPVDNSVECERAPEHPDDLKLLFMAGYSGGRKKCSGTGSTPRRSPRFIVPALADPNAINCNFAGNPLHEEQLEIIRMLGGALALNTAVDEARTFSFVNFGEIVASHFEAVGFVRDYAEVPVKRRFKTVVTSAAGYLFGQDLLPDGERYGRTYRHPWSRRPFDYCL